MMWGGFMEDLELFDASFFKISAAEASAMDPQQRLLLEYSYLAFHDAGYSKEVLQGQDAGVFVGISGTDAQELAGNRSNADVSVYSANGTTHSTAAGRLSFVFGLQGPCAAYDTACSSALVALHAAVRSLQHEECDLAVATGVSVMLTATASKSIATAGMTSSSGRCHTFDEGADGYCRSEGCGAVVLKRMGDALADQDRIHAVVRGVGVAQDGTSASLTAPNGQAQEKLLHAALRDAGLASHELDYLETHGTGTALGDPIEMNALKAVMGEGRSDEHPLVMGGVKANIGHLEPAAGIAGLFSTSSRSIHTCLAYFTSLLSS
jgi:acyl transferase domain-containing protein